MAAGDHTTPHDALFKAVFSDAESAFALVRPVLPPELVRALDPGSLQLEPASFVDDELREVHRDLLFSARLETRDVLLYILIEHQSRVDALMPLRMLRYVVRVWEAWGRKHPRARTIPAVIPVVVHQGPGPWSGPTRLADLIELPPGLLAAVAPALPAFGLTFQDVGRETTDALAQLPGPPVARLALVLLRSAAEGADMPAVLERFAALVRELLASPRGAESLRTLLRYTLVVGRLDVGQFVERVRRNVGQEAGNVAKTAGELLIEQGEAKGIRRLLERQLKARFGALDTTVLSRLEAATTPQLERWAERILNAKKVEDVFGPRRKPRGHAKG